MVSRWGLPFEILLVWQVAPSGETRGSRMTRTLAPSAIGAGELIVASSSGLSGQCRVIECTGTSTHLTMTLRGAAA